MKRRIALGIGFVCLLGAALFFSQFRHETFLLSGYLESDEIRVGSQVGGRVARVLTHEGASVEAGAALVELEAFDLTARHKQALAEAAARKADYERLAAGFRAEEIGQARAQRDRLAAAQAELVAGPRVEDIRAAEAQVDLAKAEEELAQREYNRVQSLYRREVSAREEFDRASTQLKAATAAVRARNEEVSRLKTGTRPEDLAQAKAQLEEAEQGLQLKEKGFRPEEIAAAKAAWDAAQSGVEIVEARVAELTVKAPVSGRIEALTLQPGDLLGPGGTAATIIQAGRLWVRVFVPEDRLTMKLGQKAAVRVDSFPDESFDAHVSFIATQAEFTPGNVQTPEKRAQQAFRMKVDLDAGLDRLRPGMAADVTFP